MRIEFHPDREDSATLRWIIAICEGTINANAEREARYAASEAARQGNAQQANDDAVSAAARAAFAKGLPAGSGVKTPALIGVREDTGEIDNDANAARQAFGGGATVLPFPTASGSPVSAAPSAAPAPSTTPNTASPAPVAPAAPSVPDRDSKGVPWDARIHSEARTKNNDGSWRYKRKLDDAVKKAVEAELSVVTNAAAPAVGQPPNAAVPPPPPPPSFAVPTPPPPAPPVSLSANGAASVPMPPPNDGVSNAGQPVMVPQPPVTPQAPPNATPSVAPVAPVNPTVAPPAPSSATAGGSVAAISFPELVVKLNKALTANQITQTDMETVCSELGLEGVGALSAPENAHLVGEVDRKLFGVK